MGTSVTTGDSRRTKLFYNKKFYNHSFKGQDLSHADFRSATLIGCDFTEADLSYANFEGANCRGANFTTTRLYRTNFKDAALADSIFEPKDAFGMTITLSCETFDGMKMSKLWYLVWLMLLLRSKPPEEEMELKLINVIEPERYAGLRTLFDRRVF
jgi:hypothetical protein